MLSKNVATVRVSNIAPNTQIAELYQFFRGHGLTPLSQSSLCSSFSCRDAALVATVTFETPSLAKRALDLNGQFLKSERIRIDRDFIGFTTLAAPLDFRFNIIAVHGLNGHGYGTWTSFSKDKVGQEQMWLRDVLPSQAKDARIFVYGYNSALLGSNTSVSSIQDFGIDFLQRILSYRDIDDLSGRQKPFMLICHSLGGLVVKQALITAHANRQQYGDIVDTIQSILFLATPHRGSQTAKAGALLSNLAKVAFQNPPKQLLKALDYDSGVVSKLSYEFRTIQSRFEIVNFYERRKTPIVNTLIVDEESSCLGVPNEVLVPIDATHSNICRFEGSSDPNFIPVIAHIRRMIRLAEDTKKTTEPGTRPVGPTIWVEQANSEARSYGPSLDSMYGNVQAKRHLVWRRGIFDVPHAINPNFRGRSSELSAIDSLLRANNDGNPQVGARVAIHGLGGVGKTQLATKYVYSRRSESADTSIFWISARKEEEISAGLRFIAKQLNLQWEDNHSTDDGRRRNDHADSVNSSDFLADESLLKQWMSMKESGDWLLVLDNLDDLKVKVHDFIPRGAVGSILFTTRDRNIIGPFATSGIELNAMDYESARLLFLSLCQPSTEQSSGKYLDKYEDEALIKILKELQYFPLAIDQAACFVRENAPMSLQEYFRYLQPRSEDRERLLRFKQINPDYPDSVMTTWEISLEYLNQTRPQASQILQLLGFLNNEVSEKLLVDTTRSIPWAFHPDFGERRLPEDVYFELQYLRDDVGFRIAIGSLTALSLVQRNLGRGTLTVHPLVHEWIRVRLNPTPDRQTDLTTSACRILLHNFPLELVFDLRLAHGDQFSSPESMLRRDRVQSHLGAALLNISQYCTRNVALECFLLCEVCFYAGLKEHGVRGFTFPLENWKALCSAIEAVIPLLSVHYRHIAALIHSALPMLIHQDWKTLKEVQKKILKDLKYLQVTLPSNDVVAIFLILLITTVLDVTDHCIRAQMRIRTDSINRGSINSLATQPPVKGKSEGNEDLGQTSLINFRCVKALWRVVILSLSSPLPSLLGSWLEFLILRQLAESASPMRFTTLSEISTSQLLDPKLLSYLSIEQQGHYLCNIAQRIWEVGGPKDLERLKGLFSTTSTCWEGLLEGEKKELGKLRWEQVWSASSSSYIGSSFGRSTLFENPKFADTQSTFQKDLIAPLEYVWNIALDAFLLISSPHTQWIIRRDGKEVVGTLDLIERRWAQDNSRRMKRLYDNIRARTINYFLNHMSETTFNLVEFKMAVNLQEWTTALRHVPDLFQSIAVVDICDRAEVVPWLSPTWKDPSVLTQSTKEEFNLREIDLVLADQGHGKSGAANQNVLKVGRWNIPQNCESILDSRYTSAIAACIALALSREFISQAENAMAMAKLNIIRRLQESDEAHLGRLELVYWLTQKIPDLTSHQQNFESIRFKRPKNSNSDSNGYNSEESEDSESSLKFELATKEDASKEDEYWTW